MRRVTIQGAGRVDVAIFDEERVVFHGMDLDRYGRRPALTELRDREAGVIQDRSPCAGASLRKLLCRHHSEREPGIDKFLLEIVRSSDTGIAYGAKADLGRVRDSVVEALEDIPVVEVRRVDGVTRPAKFIRKREEPRGLTVSVMEQQYFWHLGTVGRTRSLTGMVIVGGQSTRVSQRWELLHEER